MWYDDPFVKFRRRKKNRRRRGKDRTAILMVNARMEEKRRERLSRFGVLVLVLAALAGVGWVVVQGGRLAGRLLFSENARYMVRHFEIASDGNHLPASFVRETLNLHDGINLFAVNLRGLREEIETVPLVRRAEIRRILPDTLKIWVVERVAIARIGDLASPYPLTIDRHGVIMGRSAQAAALPIITGAPADRPHRPGAPSPDGGVMLAVELLDHCAADKRLARILRIERIDLSHPEWIDVYIDKGRVGHLSRDSALARLRDFAVAVQESEANGRGWTDFNLTVQANPAVR